MSKTRSNDVVTELILRMYTTSEVTEEGLCATIQNLHTMEEVRVAIEEISQDSFAKNVVLWVLRHGTDHHGTSHYTVWRREPGSRAIPTIDKFTQPPRSKTVRTSTVGALCAED